MARYTCFLGTMALSLASSACSLLFVDGPPANHQRMLYFDCTSTPGLEVADGMFALTTALAGAGTLSMTDKEFEDANNGGKRTTTAAVDFAVAGVFVGSAIYGIAMTEKCSDAKEGLRQRIMDRERKRSNARPAALPSASPPPVAPQAPPAPPSTGGEASPPPPVFPSPPPPAAPETTPTTPAPKSGAPSF